jgi:hypothetical protein
MALKRLNRLFAFATPNWLLLFLWRRLTLTVILVITLVAYVVDWSTVVAQFHRPPLVRRMVFSAQLLAIDQPDEAKAKEQVDAILAAATTQPAAGAPLANASPLAIAALRRETASLAARRPASTDYADEFRTWADAASKATSHMAAVRQPGLRAYFLDDQYLESGAGVHPYGGAADRRADATLFLDNYRAFERFSFLDWSTWNALGDLPTNVRFRPWLLHRFYDRKHFELCDNIPLAIAALLLASSFLLRFLFADYDPTARGATAMRHASKQQLWDENARSPFDAIGTGKPPVRRWIGRMVDRWLPWVGLIGLVTAEFCWDRPETAVSWPLKIISIGLAGLLVPVVWITIGRLRGMRFDARWRQTGNREVLAKVIRPFTFGAAALLFVAAWAGLYSAFALVTAVEEPARVRGILQTAAVLYTCWTVWRLIAHLNKELRRPDDLVSRVPEEAPASLSVTKAASGPEEDRFNVLAGIFPGLQEATVRAVLLALIPLPEIFKLFG